MSCHELETILYSPYFPVLIVVMLFRAGLVLSVADEADDDEQPQVSATSCNSKNSNHMNKNSDADNSK